MKTKKIKIFHHYEIDFLLKLLSPWNMSMWVCGIFGLLLIYSGEYSNQLMAFDITCLLMVASYKVIILPLIQRGTLKVYYRRSYLRMYGVLKTLYLIILAGACKAPLLILYILVAVASGKKFNKLINQALTDGSFMVFLGLMIGILFMFLLYFSKKEISSEKYTEDLMVICRNMSSMNYEKAHYHYIKILEQQDLQDLVNDIDMSDSDIKDYIPGCKKVEPNKCSKYNDNNNSNIKSDKSNDCNKNNHVNQIEEKNESDLVRRKARRLD